MSNSATVVLGHKESTYRGEQKESFTGVVKIKNKDYLLSISAEDGTPISYESKKDGTPIIYCNVVALKPKSERKQRNEI